MASLLYHVFSSTTLICQGLHHLITTTKNHLKSPLTYSAKPFHPFNNRNRFLKHTHLYLIIISLFISLIHQLILSSYSDPLIKGRTPVHHYTSLLFSTLLFSFLVLSIALLISDATSLLPLPSDIFFAIASALFFLEYAFSSNSASLQISDLQAKCDLTSAYVFLLSSLMCGVLAFNSRIYVADVGLGVSFLLQGMWEMQTGLSLYVDAFIPEGCHKLLDVVSGVEGSTKCELEDSKMRAVAILDLVFVVHVVIGVGVFVGVYALVARTLGVVSRFGSYEVLPNVEGNHVQLKEMAGTQA